MSIEKQIGAKVLSQTMMECIFQYTESVLDTIQNIRSIAVESQTTFCEELLHNPHEAVMKAHGYNNAISILGSRGAGKTSVIMTLQTILQVGKEAWEKGDYTSNDPTPQAENNIIMPILVPQDFTNGQSLLSWVIMQLCRKGEEIETEQDLEYTGFFSKNSPLFRWMPANKRDYKCDPLRECMNTLIRAFELRYRFDTNRLGLEADQVFEYMDEVKYDASIAVEMLKLISMMADYYRYKFAQSCTSVKKETNKEPLFFFVIDDLDLAPDRSQEILNLILRYLQHPNVVVLCGWNQELFQSHLCVDLFKSQGILNTSLLNTNLGYDDVFMKRQRKRVAVLDSARRLAADNLKKAFPPSQRYEIRGLLTKQRAFFPYKINQELKPEENSFLPLIDQTLSIRLKQSDVSFMRNYCGEYMFVYMRIFDNKARGLINVYRAFETLNARLAQWNRESELDLTADIRSLLNTILYSNTHFVPYLRGLRDLVKIEKVVLSENKEEAVCDFFCDYKSVKNVLAAYQLKGEKYSLEYLLEREYNYFPSVVIDVYILLNFIENMLLQLSGRPRFEHGGRVFSEVLNSINLPVRTKTDTGSPLSLALSAAGIEQFSLFPTTDDFRINLVLLDYYEKNGFSDQNYDFTGLYGYRRLMESVNSLARIPDQSSNSRPKYRVDWLRRRVPEWTDMMERLFDALTYSDDHVMRLSKYRSFILQGLYEYESELLKTASENNTRDFEALLKQKDSCIKDYISDDLFEAIINCARQTEKNRNDFRAFSDWPKRKRNDVIAVSSTVQRASRYLFLCNDFIHAEKFDYTTFQKYKTSLEDFKPSKPFGTMEADDNLVKEAELIAGRMLSRLLEYLKTSLEEAFIYNYPSGKSAPIQFEYLLSASKAIAYYRDEWNVGLGSWSAVESGAVADIIELFRKYQLWSQINTITEMDRIGQSLEKAGRAEYNSKLFTMKKWINDNNSRFSEQDQSQFNASFAVLESAPRRIRRDMETENAVNSILMEVGNTIAQGCALIGLTKSVLEDKSSDERLNTSWPIIKASRDELSKLAEPFLQQSRKKKNSLDTGNTQFRFQ